MKYFSKILLLFSFALILVVPSVASASWWNPFSWFKKNTPPVTIPSSNSNKPTTTFPGVNSSSSAPVQTPGNATSSAASSKPLPSTAKPPVTTMPVQAKPVIKPTSTTSTPTKPVATSTNEVKIVAPSFILDSAYTPGGFTSPRDVKTGTVFLIIESDKGSGSPAIGNWYLDKIVWRLVSQEYRSGDLTVSVSSGQKFFEDSSFVNEPRTTMLSSHVASDPITFMVNGRIPQKGYAKVVVDEIYGHMKNGSTTVYKLNGTPLVGPEFYINNN